ncbi:MAG: hypothetical protein QOJ56_3799, partial [Mycobacterium sp.]|nr:hypothetical protein [Mycobacterium sp.]
RIRALFGSRERHDYFVRQFCNPAIQRAYAVAFAVWRDPRALAAASGIDPGPGFLIRLMEHLADSWRITEPDQRLRDTARETLEEFILRAIGDNTAVYIQGNYSEVAAHIDRDVTKSTSGHFIGALLRRLISRERERLPHQPAELLDRAAQQRADELIDALAAAQLAADASPEQRREFFESILSRMSQQADDVGGIEWCLRKLGS